MGKARRSACIQIGPYQISSAKALGLVFSHSNKIHKSKSFSQANKYVSAVALSQREHLQVDYDALREISEKSHSWTPLRIYEAQSDLSQKFQFGPFCEVVAGKCQFPYYMWGHQSTARLSGLALFTISIIKSKFPILYVSQLCMVECFRYRLRAIFHRLSWYWRPFVMQ